MMIELDDAGAKVITAGLLLAVGKMEETIRTLQQTSIMQSAIPRKGAGRSAPSGGGPIVEGGPIELVTSSGRAPSRRKFTAAERAATSRRMTAYWKKRRLLKQA